MPLTLELDDAFAEQCRRANRRLEIAEFNAREARYSGTPSPAAQIELRDARAMCRHLADHLLARIGTGDTISPPSNGVS
jgi:hypothetical protein